MAMAEPYPQESLSYRRLNNNFERSMSNSSYSTPSLSFALGAALVLLTTALATFCFSFWYHWRKISRRTRSLQGLSGDSAANLSIFVNGSSALPHELAAGDAIKPSVTEKPIMVKDLRPKLRLLSVSPRFACDFSINSHSELAFTLASAGSTFLTDCFADFSAVFLQITTLIPVVMPGDETPKYVARECRTVTDVSEDEKQPQTTGVQDELPKTTTSQLIP